MSGRPADYDAGFSRRLVFVEREDPAFRVVAVNLWDGNKEKLTEAPWWSSSRPHFSADGQLLFFSGPPGPGTLYRLRLKERSKPEPLTQLERGTCKNSAMQNKCFERKRTSFRLCV